MTCVCLGLFANYSLSSKKAMILSTSDSLKGLLTKSFIPAAKHFSGRAWRVSADNATIVGHSSGLIFSRSCLAASIPSISAKNAANIDIFRNKVIIFSTVLS